MLKNFKSVSMLLLLMGAGGLSVQATVNSDAIDVQAAQQVGNCNGIVKDGTGEPMIGVAIMIKNSSKGTVTGIDGNFSLQGVKKGDVLVLSYVGCVTQEIKWDGKPLNVVMKEDSQVLNEVVVVGYGVQKKANLSGAVSTVDTKQIENRPVLNVGQALQGTVANLNVTVGTGQAISTPSFNIRGTNSINGGSPLIIIDGVASDAGQLNRMNPNDIASMSVLKDAASCAIYGSKAAYGVILITTKQGKTEKLQINYNNNISFTKNTKMPEIVTDPYTVATIRNQMYIPWGTIYNDKELEYAKQVSAGTADPFYINEDGYYKYFGQTDWVAETFKNSSFATNHSVDLSGSTDKVDYYFSAGYNYQNGMIKYNTDSYNRYNLTSKLNFKITDRWSVSNTTTFNSYDYKAPTNLSSSLWWEVNRISPLDVPRNPDGTWTNMGASVLGLLRDGGDWKKYETLVRTQFGSRFDIIKNVLFVQGSLAYTSNKHREQWYYAPIAYKEGPEKPVRYRSEVTSAYAGNNDNKDIYIDVYATFHKTFKKHDVTAMIGFNQEEYEYYNSNLSRKDLITTSVPSPGLATGDMNVGEGMGSSATRSGFGRIGYVYDDKYIVEFNGRYDGTSKFPKNDRFVFSPSFSAAWVISSEKFFEPLKNTISFLKLRGSYGQLGNQEIGGYYPYLATMGNGKMGAIIDGKQPVYISAPGLVSSSLTWEKVRTMNFGADVNFFNNRLSLSGEYYERRTLDMLTAGKPLPNVLGTSVPLANAADLKTRGWELTIIYKDQFKLAGKPLHFSANFNISDSRAFITKFDNYIEKKDKDGNTYITQDLNHYYVGYEMGQMWGLTTLGFFTSQEDRDNWANQDAVTAYPGSPKTGAGDLKFADLNGDGRINNGEWTLANPGDYKIIGNTRARFNYGLQLNADWNGFDIGVFLQGVGKKDYYPANDIYFWGCYFEPWSNITKGNLVDHWTPETPNAYFPRMKSYMAYYTEGSIAQTRYKQNASYLRLKNLQIGYTLPKNWVEKVGLTNLRVFFTGDNLAVWSGLYKYYKMDPEGLGGSGYPLQKACSFGLNVSF